MPLLPVHFILLLLLLLLLFVVVVVVVVVTWSQIKAYFQTNQSLHNMDMICNKMENLSKTSCI